MASTPVTRRCPWWPIPPRRAGWPDGGVGLALLVVLSAGAAVISSVSAQSTNGTTRLVYETVVSGGGWVGGGNPVRLMTALGEPIGGTMVNGTLRLGASYPPGGVVLPAGRRTIEVEGTVDDPATTLTVNDVPAEVTGTAFLARNIPIVEGSNGLTIVATDRVGNRTTALLTVYLHTRPPSRPTVDRQGLGERPTGDEARAWPPSTYLSRSARLTLRGSKLPGTSIWVSVNGGEPVQLVALNQDTVWEYAIDLTEGDNELRVTTRDAADNESTAAVITVVLDEQPPKIFELRFSDADGNRLHTDSRNQDRPKTNLAAVTVSGRADDALTTVALNATEAGTRGAFAVEVPLREGDNLLTLTATSPNGHVSTLSLVVIRGTIPLIASVDPPDRGKRYVETATTIRASAEDHEGDAVTYQILLDGAMLREWAPEPSVAWTPSEAQAGMHPVEVRARDDFGGVASKSVRVLILRRPIEHP